MNQNPSLFSGTWNPVWGALRALIITEGPGPSLQYHFDGRQGDSKFNPLDGPTPQGTSLVVEALDRISLYDDGRKIASFERA